SAGGVLIKDAGLCADDEVVLPGVADPRPVVTILKTAVGINALHRCLVRRVQVVILARQADPAKGAVAEVEEQGDLDAPTVRWPEKTAAVVVAVLAELRDAGIEDGFHEAVAVIEEIDTAFGQTANRLEMPPQ